MVFPVSPVMLNRIDTYRDTLRAFGFLDELHRMAADAREKR